MSTFEYIDLHEYIILYFESVKVYGNKQGNIYDEWNTTEFRKYNSDNKIYYYVNGKHESWTSAIPVAVKDKLTELETYDVVLQKIQTGRCLIEIRKYKEGQYGEKKTIKSEFIKWDSEYPDTLDTEVTKEAVQQEIDLVPFQLNQQKIEAEQKEEKQRRLREYWARDSEEKAAMRQLKEQRNADIQSMIEQFPQFPHIEEYLRKTIKEEADMKENATIIDLRAKVSNLETKVNLSQREITELKNMNTHLVGENKRLLRENEGLIKKNTWSLFGWKGQGQQVPVENLLIRLKQSSDASFVCQ
jgi:hypothetical protein